MMIGHKKCFVFVCLLVCNVVLFAQTPAVVPLDYNPALRVRKPTMLKSSVTVDTVSLPFFDDFSYFWDSEYMNKPDKRLWIDDYVYINNHYPVQPRSNGVATFDALDANGNIYRNSSATFPADTLTSCPIDLAEEGIRNVYLSFFYQPQGNGDSPESGDSLILQFKEQIKLIDNDSVTYRWNNVWSTPGTTLHPFKQVLKQVDDKYFYKGFQFRFVNFVSLEQDRFNLGKKGDADHWHIDYVYMNSNRSATDTAYHDMTIIAPMKSLIRGYQSIPWNQLQFASANRIDGMIEMIYFNNNNTELAVTGIFEITDLYNKITNSVVQPGSNDIKAGEVFSFRQNIPNNIFESTSVDSALFELKGYMRTDEIDRKVNDTVRYYQFFKDYFARDDGNPESGYGFSGYNAQGCAVACRYETLMPDNLKAVMIYFNPTDNNVSAQYRFRIAVWRDDNGRPGEMIYLSTAEYRPEKTGQFTIFELEREIFVTRNYWIGWVQVTSGFLNVGFDRNHNDKGNLWYNTGNWYEDTNDGTLMIRPVLGPMNVISSNELPATNDIGMKLYPNPASQNVRIEFETSEIINHSDYQIEIYDAAGRLHYSAPYTAEFIDVSAFATGIYIVRLIDRKTGNVHVQKLIVLN